MEEQVKKIVRGNILSEEFTDMLKKNIMPFSKLMSCYKCAMMEIETKFNVLDEQFSLQYDRNPIESIKTRLKSLESIAKKLQRKNLPLSVQSIEQNLNDVAGIRIICSFPEDIYYLAGCLLKQDDIKLIEKRDYITNPKPSGYRSLHLIVEVPIFLENEKRPMRAEVQLRTIAMDFWASLEHKLRYKKNIPEEEASRISGELIECANISAELDNRMQDIRKQISTYNENK